MWKRVLGRKGCVDLEASHPGILARLDNQWSCAGHCLAQSRLPGRPAVSKLAPEETSCLASVFTVLSCFVYHLRANLLRPASAFDDLLICAASDDIRPDIPLGRATASCGQCGGQRALM